MNVKKKIFIITKKFIVIKKKLKIFCTNKPNLFSLIKNI